MEKPKVHRKSISMTESWESMALLQNKKSLSRPRLEAGEGRRAGGVRAALATSPRAGAAADLRIVLKIPDFRGFYSSRTLSLRGGMLMSMGDLPESLRQGILAGKI